MRRRFADVLGIGYLVVSMGLSCYSLYLFAPYMANDFFWRDFDATTVSTALAAAFRTQLLGNASRHSFDLMAFENGVPLAQYDARGNTRVFTRMLLYDKLTTVQDGINGLRRLETRLVTNLMTAYCWVDLQQRWALAHSAARQERCVARYTANGAVYLEATLRNIQLRDWLDLNGARFNFAIADAVAASIDGQRWLSSLMAHEWVSVPDEVDLWASFHVTRYELQYANRVATGIQDTVDVTNAMGQVRSLVIGSSPTRAREAGWTTGNLVGTFEYDLQALGHNQSLVRNATTFFGSSDPLLLVEFNYGVPTPYEVLYRSSQLSNASELPS
ncbi:hypothetical protein SPRG_00618 [Saprolegnia parasitica CBS 223.65]|uniref:Uncharacterized protein n=1 Tax=Saprolegnia parasitica (strain CBS 223.65) TaxID=695850 RepID=A0A067CZ61_SAPPC|nr:hypothetical protein SPRG_00618 [Saprolegnia parasitica CBS 223.65]KDO34555.1 hypothetical protein SPRG_00618 [Saprolegnia parasitica CBS 223.65]|eukprot:XP_012194232.1 hypothetical protein SPRG_00618 [Saprolegnia parasitica CBS 223.65]